MFVCFSSHGLRIWHAGFRAQVKSNFCFPLRVCHVIASCCCSRINHIGPFVGTNPFPCAMLVDLKPASACFVRTICQQIYCSIIGEGRRRRHAVLNNYVSRDQLEADKQTNSSLIILLCSYVLPHIVWSCELLWQAKHMSHSLWWHFS